MVFPYKRSKSGLKKEEAGQTASLFLQIRCGWQTKAGQGDAAGIQSHLVQKTRKNLHT